MIITRTSLPSPGPGLLRTQIEVFVVECEACGFSAVSHYEHDAIAIVERHQARCQKFLDLWREREASPSKRPPAPAVHGSRK